MAQAYDPDEIDDRVNTMIRMIMEPARAREKTPRQQIQEFRNVEGMGNTLKEKYMSVKRKCEQLQEHNMELNNQIVDLRAKARLAEEQHQNELKQVKQEAQNTAQQILNRNKQIIDKLVAEKEDLASQNQRIAADMLSLQQSFNAKVFEQNKQLSTELESLKLNFDTKLNMEKQKIMSKSNQVLKQKVSEAVAQNERNLAAKIEPQIQEIIAKNQTEQLKIKADYEQQIA